MIKFRASFGKIEQIECVRETPKQVVHLTSYGKEVKSAKQSSYESWHDTLEEAHAALVEEEENHVNKLRQQLERANGRLGQVKGMKKP